MAGRSMSLDVLVRLKDLLSGPLRGLRRNLQTITGMARNIGLVGTAVAAISFMGPIQEAAAFQQQLLDIAGTQNLVGKQAFASVDGMKERYEGLALEIGQLSDTVAKGAGQMIAAGVNDALVDASIGSIGRAATAANAEFSDMAGVATSLLTTLKLPADQLDASLAALVVAGKEGAFELKDMAKYFPTLTSQMAKFGVTGRESVNFLASALQIARKGTADPAEAANNLKNFLSKILAPATIKNFSDAGVDIEAVMRDAATKGINPIEAVVQKISKLTGVSGGEIEKLMQKAKANGLEGAGALEQVREQLQQIHGAGALGEIFGDMQVMDFLIPMLSNIDEYKRIKDEVAKATGDMIDADFETQMQGMNRQLQIFNEIGSQAGREVGFAFGAWLPTLNSGLMTALKWMRDLDKQTGGMVRQALSFAGAGLLVAAGLGALGIILPVIGAGLSIVGALIGPIGVAIAGIALAGKWVYDNWSDIAPALGDLWNATKEKASQLWEVVSDGASTVMQTGRRLWGQYSPMIRNGVGRAWDWTRNMAGRAATEMVAIGGRLVSGARGLVASYGPTLVNGMTGAWDATLTGMKQFGEGFAPFVDGIISNMGGVGSNIASIASDFWRFWKAIAGLVNIDLSGASNVMKTIGEWAGMGLGGTAAALKMLTDGIASFVKFQADLAEGKANLSDLVPDWLSKGIDDAVRSVTELIAKVRSLPGEFMDAATQAGQQFVDGIKTKVDEVITYFKNLPGQIAAVMGSYNPFAGWGWGGGNMPANDNPAAPAAPPPQRVDATLDATIKVDGAGRVTEQKSSIQAPSSTPNTGTATGRP